MSLCIVAQSLVVCVDVCLPRLNLYFMYSRVPGPARTMSTSPARTMSASSAAPVPRVFEDSDNDVVIVSTRRTPICKSTRGGFKVDQQSHSQGGRSGQTTPTCLALKGHFSADCSSANILNIIRL